MCHVSGANSKTAFRPYPRYNPNLLIVVEIWRQLFKILAMQAHVKKLRVFAVLRTCHVTHVALALIKPLTVFWIWMWTAVVNFFTVTVYRMAASEETRQTLIIQNASFIYYAVYDYNRQTEDNGLVLVRDILQHKETNTPLRSTWTRYVIESTADELTNIFTTAMTVKLFD